MTIDKNQFADDFLDAVSLERESDIELVNDLLGKLSSKKLSQEGLAVLNLNIANIRSGLGGRTLIELENDNAVTNSEEINNGEIRVGDIVKVEKIPSATASKKKQAANAAKKSHSKKSKDIKESNNANEADLATIEGVVTKISLTCIIVAVDESFEDNLLKLGNERVWIVKVANSITYKRMESTLRKLKEINDLSPIMQLLLGQSQFIPPSESKLQQSFQKIKFKNDQLNDSQKQAIIFSLNSNLSIIHGPPGTGKTYTLIELIQQLLLNGNQRILVCGPSNISIDTIIERLDKLIPYTKLLRVGHPSRLLPSIQRHSLDFISKSGENSEVTGDIRREIIENLKTIKKLKSYKERKQLWNENKFLKKDLRIREKKKISELIVGAQVVAATLHGASSRELVAAVEANGEKPLFDCLIIDEVSQSLEPQCWIPLISHPGIKKIVLAGDNKQLPPTVKLDDHEILSKGQKKSELNKAMHFKKLLETTLFDRLIKIHPEKELKQLLNVQYRMNEQIMQFSSQQLYDGQLEAADSVKDRLLSDLGDVVGNDDTNIPVIWYDTQGGDFPEQEDAADEVGMLKQGLTSSKFNENEVLLTLKHIQDLINSNVPEELIGVISPYNLQVSMLKQKIHTKYPKIEISTIDGFQGREKDVIILSLVRSNLDKLVGFLKDERRLNVAITRPKRQLCVIGDMETIGESKNLFLTKWVKWAEDNADLRYPDLSELLNYENTD